MTSAAADNLSRDKIQQLLAAVGSKQTEDGAKVEAAEYNWHQPHYFNSTQLNRLNDLTRKIAAAVGEKLAVVLHGDFDVSITTATQHFASELLDQIIGSEQSDYYLAFGLDQEHLRGLISLPPQTAVTLVTQLLGDCDSETDTGKALSQLEESLLCDIGSAIVDVLSTFLRGHYDLRPAKTVTRGRLPIDLQRVEEFCKITFSIQKTNSEDSCTAHLLAPSNILAPLVGKTPQTDSQLPTLNTPKAMLSHVHEMPICVTARLASTVLTFEQIMNLRAGDILLLDKRIDESVELIIDGRVFFRGQPAKSAGQHAVAITESPCHTENTNTVAET